MLGTLAAILHNASAVLGVGAAILAVLAFLNLGLLLPGLLGWLDGGHRRAGNRLLEPGPGAPPVISEPAHPRPTPGDVVPIIPDSSRVSAGA